MLHRSGNGGGGGRGLWRGGNAPAEAKEEGNALAEAKEEGDRGFHTPAERKGKGTGTGEGQGLCRGDGPLRRHIRCSANVIQSDIFSPTSVLKLQVALLKNSGAQWHPNSSEQAPMNSALLKNS